MKIDLKKIVKSKQDTMLLMGISLIMLKIFLNTSLFVNLPVLVERAVLFLAYLLLSICIFIDEKKIKNIFYYVIFFILLIYSNIVSKNSILFYTVLTILAFRNFNFNRLVDYILKLTFMIIITNVLLSLIFLIFGNSEYCYTIISGVLRYRFGFSHPNVLSLLIFNSILMWVWLNYSKFNIKICVSILLIALFSFIFTKTRTTFLLTVLYILLLFFQKKYRLLTKYLNVVSKIIIPSLFILFCLFIVFYWDFDFIRFIDFTLSGRIKLGSYAYSKIGLTMFGQDASSLFAIKWDPLYNLTSFTFDGSYIIILCNLGIIWAFILSYLFYNLAKKNNPIINCYIIVWALYSASETHSLNCFYFFPTLLLLLLFTSKKKEALFYEKKY